MGAAIVLAAIAGAVLLFLAYTYNRLVRLRNETQTGWANIDVQLKRRSDLVPNLVEAVKGYAAHERETFEAVTEPAPQRSGRPGRPRRRTRTISSAAR